MSVGVTIKAAPESAGNTPREPDHRHAVGGHAMADYHPIPRHQFCSVCARPDISAITARILAGESITAIAKSTGLTAMALFQHRRRHVVGKKDERHEKKSDARHYIPCPLCTTHKGSSLLIPSESPMKAKEISVALGVTYGQVVRHMQRHMRIALKIKPKPSKCPVCDHRNYRAIEERLLQFESFGAIATDEGVSKASLSRHMRHAFDRGQLAGSVSDAILAGRRVAPMFAHILAEDSDPTHATAYARWCEWVDTVGGRRNAYHFAHRDRRLADQRARRRALRDEVVAAYGGACACCGESEPEFLSIDHVDESGAEHRRALGGKQGEARRFSAGGEKTYRWLKDRGFPRGGFQLLCMNCNFAKGKLGECPHKSRRAE